MTTYPVSTQGFSMPLIEGGLTAIAIVTAFFWPTAGSPLFTFVERFLGPVARQRRLAVLVPGAAVLVLRVAMLPILPVPLPFVPDDFSFLLASETFASGRLTNPTPAMWTHFESIHITMTPTYMSMYFPAHGLLLAAGKLVFGHPWSGVLISSALMCSAVCWMLQAWLPPSWAFLGGMVAVLRLGLFSYWTNTYHSAGSIAALGGALVLGSLPRLVRRWRPRDGIIFGAGAVILAASRPFEGLLLCIPAIGFLALRLYVSRKRPAWRRVVKVAALASMIVLAGGAWMAYYDYRAFGNPLTPPYAINRATYASAPYYVWQPERPVPGYRHAVLRDFYQYEVDAFAKIHRPGGFIPQTLFKALRGLLFYAGMALALPLVLGWRVALDRRMRFLMVSLLILIAGMTIEVFLLPHYLAPFTAGFYALGLQCMRHLRLWRWEGRPVGLALVRGAVLVCCMLASLRLAAHPLHIALPEWPASEWLNMWYGPQHFGVERQAIQDKLERLPGKHLVIVRYSPDHYAFDEWVYNAPDIDRSKVIWARDMDAASNAELLAYYRDRRVWLVQPDLKDGTISRYPVMEAAAGARELAQARTPATSATVR